MRFFYFSLLAAAVACVVTAGVSGSQTTSTTSVSIPRGVIVPVLVTREVRVGGLGESTASTKVEFAIYQDVIVNGYVILKAGDPVEGHYTTQRNVTRRFLTTNISQELALDMDDAINFCGDTVHLTFERTYVGGGWGYTGSRGGYASHDAVFAKGLVLKAHVDRFEKSICAEQTTEVEASLPANIVVPDDEISPTP